MRYLLGSGHPDHPLLRDTFATDGDYGHGNEVFRARLLLLAVSDSDLMPVDRDWHIMVMFLYTLVSYLIY